MTDEIPTTPAASTPAAWRSSYDEWTKTPTPEKLHAVVKTLSPTIGYAVASVGGINSPVLQSRAMLHAAKAVTTYKPDMGASLPTYVGSQLRSLTRDARETTSVGRVPERAQLDAVRLHRAEQEFEDEHGRQPDIVELSDHTGMPADRIAKVRSYTNKQILADEFSNELPNQSPDYDKEAVEYILNESDHLDRKILEHKTGYGGAKILSPLKLCFKLRMTPSQLSRRSQRLTYRLNKISQQLKRV